jgi:hypothetical protein
MNMQASWEAELYEQEDVHCVLRQPARRRLFTVLVCRQAMGRTGRQAKGLYGRQAGGCTTVRSLGRQEDVP